MPTRDSTNRRAFISGLCTAAIFPTAARAQTTETVYRIGVLTPGPAPAIEHLLTRALPERGWVVGRNLVVDIRYTQGDPQRAEVLARELVNQRVSLIVTHFTTTAMAARRATGAIPIVMATSGFPVEGGLANSLARPGGNVTGMTSYAGGGPIFGKYLQLLRELVPSLREFGVFWGYAPPSYKLEQVAPAIEELHRAATALNVGMRFWPTGSEGDLATALAAVTSRPPDALFVTSGIIHAVPETAAKLARFVAERRLTIVTDGSLTTGAVAAYYPERAEVAARVADFIDRILKGAKPGDLPIEQSTKYELAVSLKMARSVGRTVPQSLLARADRVIE